MSRPILHYWRAAVGLAVRAALPKSPRQVISQIVTFLLALWVLRFVIAPDAAGDRQMTEEIRWALSVVGAFALLVVVSFFVQLAVVPLQLQEAAVAVALQMDRASRKNLRRRVLEQRLHEGTELRQRIYSLRGHWSTPTLAEIGRDIRRWQQRTIRSVKRCDPNHFVDWRAAAGNVLPEFTAAWLATGWQNEIDARLTQWMLAIAGLDVDD